MKHLTFSLYLIPPEFGFSSGSPVNLMVYCDQIALVILIIVLICSLYFQIIYALCLSLLHYDFINVTSCITYLLPVL